MNNKCINLKQKLDRSLYCKINKCSITLKDCNNCKFKEFSIERKNDKIRSINSKTHNKSAKIVKMEKNRKSILTDNLNYCIICGAEKDHLHEIFFGRNRLNSIKYDLVIPLCFKCHKKMHKNIIWQDYWHKKGQLAFIESYPDLDFMSIFRKNYL